MSSRTSLVLSTLLMVAAGPSATGSADEPGKSAADPMFGKEAGQVRDDNGLAMKLVWCSAGIVPMENVETFTERHQFVNNVPTRSRLAETIAPVNAMLSTGFWIGKFEATQAEWKEVMNSAPWKVDPNAKEGNDLPVTGVSWDDAMRFCRKLTEQEQMAGRLSASWQYTLPTEAQWERACRARTETKFSFGDDEAQLGDFGWFNLNTLGAGEPFAHRVGRKKANPWGLHDMHGNVWEWCRDQNSSPLAGGRDPEVREGGIGHSVRGGSFNDSPVWCRSAYRPLPGSGDQPKAAFIGFRVALTPVRAAK